MDKLSKDRWDIRDLDMLDIPRKEIKKAHKGTKAFKDLVKS
jgi:hypothetical protein